MMASNGVYNIFPEDEVDLDEPTLEEDMAKFPGKTREQVKLARGLWSRCILAIHNDDSEHSDHATVFVPKDLIISQCGRINKLVPTAKSWPILEWDSIIDKSWRFGFWYEIDNFLEFLYTGDENFEADCSIVLIWAMGAALECPKYQNVAMEYLFKSDSEEEATLKSEILETSKAFGILASCHLSYLDRIVAQCETFSENKLLSYVIDKLVWDALHGGSTWLGVVHRGTCIANMVAKACFDAAKKPRPRFPPWHIFNHKKYLLYVDPVTFKAIENQDNTATAEKSKKRKRVE